MPKHGEDYCKQLAKMKFLKIFLDSWKVLNNKKVLAIVGIEFLFFLLLMINAIVSVNFISGKVNDLKDFNQEFSVDENSDTNYLYGSLVFLSQILDDIVKTVVIFAVISFILFGFFMGILWKWSFNFIHKKNLLKDYNRNYFFNFYLLSLIWFVFFAGAFYLLYNFGFSYEIFALICILFIYLVWINLSCFAVDNKILNSFLNGLKLSVMKFYFFIPAFISLWVLLYAFSYLFGVLNNNNILSLIGSLIGIFLFVWFRIFLIMICGEQDSNLRRH